MAPVLSKMPSPDAQSSFPSTNQLTDDSLLVLLSLLPLDVLLNQANLVCKRWQALLPLVLRKRHALIIYAYPIDLPERNQFFTFKNKSRLPSAQYGAYLNSLLGPGKPKALPWVPTLNLKDGFRVERHHRFFKASFGKFLACHFGSLTHLSLVEVKFQLEPLLSLLATYRDCLQSLAIKNLILSDEKTPDCSSLCQNYATTDSLLSQEENLAHLWPLIDSMPVLTRFALGFSHFFFPYSMNLRTLPPALSPVLPNLLPRLVSFTLDGYDRRMDPICEALNVQILTELHLFNCGSSERLLRLVVLHCPGVRHLGISTDWSLSNLLPQLAQLRALTSLQLDSPLFDLFRASYQGAHLLTSLRLLNLQTLLNTQTFSILPFIAPNLRQLYLERATLQLDGNCRIPLNTVDPILIEKLANSKQMTQLIGVINSFDLLPKIETISELNSL